MARFVRRDSGSLVFSGSYFGSLEVSQADEVEGGRGQLEDSFDSLETSQAGFSQAADSFHPAKDGFDQLAAVLAGVVARVPSGSSIDSAAPVRGVLCATCGVTFRSRRASTNQPLS